MVWKCSCGTQNELYNLSCTSCNKEIPQCERKRIYRHELMHHIEECIVLVKNSAAVSFIKNKLYLIKMRVKDVLSGTSKDDLKIAIIPIIFISFFIINIIIQITSLKISHTRTLREERKLYSIERRTELNDNIKSKLEYAIVESGFSKIDTMRNLPVKEHIEAKKRHLLEKTKIAMSYLIETVERGYEKCRSYFE